MTQPRSRARNCSERVVAILVAACAESPLQRGESWALLWLWLSIPLRQQHLGPAALANPETARRTLNRAPWPAMLVAAAVTTLIAIFAARPLLATYVAGRATQLESEGVYPAAIDGYRRAIALGPAASSATFNLPRALAATGDHAAASAAAADALRWIDEPETHLLRIRIFEASGDRISALEEAIASTRRFPYSTVLHQELLQLAASVPIP